MSEKANVSLIRTLACYLFSMHGFNMDPKD